MDLTRRESLAAAGAVALGGCAAVGRLPLESVEAQSLDSLARRSGRRFGTALGTGIPGGQASALADASYRAIVAKECGVIVPENELKWQWTRPSAPTFDFRSADLLLDWARTAGMAIRGHTLLWVPEKWYPKWLLSHDFGPRPESAAADMLVQHIQTVCRRYGSRIYSYDVVNEAVQPETGAIRDTVLTRAMGGEAMLDLMFRTARAEAPHAQLVYNDYMSWERGTEDETHINGVLKLLEGFRKRGTPVDALGIQSHIRLLKAQPVADIVRESEGPWRRFLDAVVAMGYGLEITEFDVNDRMAPDDIAVRDAMVAEYANAYLDIMLSYPQLGDVVAWGMVDRYSWLTDFDPRHDKSIKRGTPYDSEYVPKPLRAAIARSLADASSQHRRMR
jgi:endo-1,4-beta-xylanase